MLPSWRNLSLLTDSADAKHGLKVHNFRATITVTEWSNCRLKIWNKRCVCTPTHSLLCGFYYETHSNPSSALAEALEVYSPRPVSQSHVKSPHLGNDKVCFSHVTFLMFVWRSESFGFLPKGEASKQYRGVTPLCPLMCEVATQLMPASCIQYPNWAAITASLWRALLQLHDTIISEASHAKLPNEKLETSNCLLSIAKIIRRSVTWEHVHLNFGKIMFQFNSFSVAPT